MPALSRRRIETAAGAEELVRLLIDAGQELPRRLRQRIMDRGPAAVPPLLALAEDEELSYETAPGEGWGPIHAVELLGELRAPEAIELMIGLLEETDPDAYLHDTVLRMLPRLGPAVLEPALAAYAAADDPEFRGSLCSVLSELGVRDDRIYEVLVEDSKRDPVLAAMHFGRYGDRRALSLLSDALDRYESQGDEPFANQEIIEIEAAIEELGGELTPEQREKVERILAPEMANRRVWSSLMERTGRGVKPRMPAARRIGRNDPCPCGSGLKHKKCCLGKTER